MSAIVSVYRAHIIAYDVAALWRSGGGGGGKNRGNSRFCLRLDRNDPDFPANYDYSEGGGRERGKRKEFGERSIIGGGGEGGL